MIAVKKILVPVDFSDTSKPVLEFGRLLADACDASLHLLYVIGDPLAAPQTIDREHRPKRHRIGAVRGAGGEGGWTGRLNGTANGDGCNDQH